MIIQVKNNVSYCFGGSAYELEQVSDILSFKHPKARFMESHKLFLMSDGRAGWDGFIRFFKKRSSSFPTGLLPFLYKILVEKEIPVELKDLRDRPPIVGLGRLEGVQLEDHQRGVLDILDNEFEGIPWVRGIFDHCTSSGKTYSATTLIKRIGQDTIYVVPKKDLLIQTQEILEKHLDESVGKMGDKWFELDKKYTVATVQMLVSRFLTQLDTERMKFVKRQRVLVCDETHHIQDNVWAEAVKLFPCYYRFGFSGTPFDTNTIANIHLIASTGDIFHVVKSKELMGKKLLSNIQLHILDVNQPQLIPYNYHDAYNLGIVENEYRNNLIADVCKAAYDRGHLILIFISILKHGHTLQSVLTTKGINAIFLKGEDKVVLRRDVVKNIAERRVVIASTIWDEGIDAPAIDFLIPAGGGKSRRKVLQRIGRGLRTKKDRENLLRVVDFMDRTNRHLLKHSQNRIQVYNSEGWDVETVNSIEEIFGRVT